MIIDTGNKTARNKYSKIRWNLNHFNSWQWRSQDILMGMARVWGRSPQRSAIVAIFE